MDIVFDFLQNNKDKLKPLGFFGLTVLGLYGINSLLKIKVDEQQEEDQQGKKPAGIMNEGNTCFVNSLLQALSSVQTFKQNIQTLLKISVPQDNTEDLIRQLNKVIKKINSNSQNISVMNLLDILSKSQSQLINFQQQDTYQLYSAIVRAFDQFYNKRKQANLSKSIWTMRNQQIQNSLLGYTKSSIQCTQCKNTMTIKIHSFYDLSLQISPNFIVSLKSALIWHQRKQKIQNYACTFCSIKNHIQKLERIKKRLNDSQWSRDLISVNQKLINYLKKNAFEDMDLKQINMELQEQVTQFTDIFHKIGDNPYRNEIFSLIKPIERSILKQTKIAKYPKILVIHFKQLVINPYTGQPAYMRKPIQFPSKLQIPQKTHIKVYKLTSLLTHIGNEQMGHYFTFRKSSKDSEEWFLISDTHTQKVSQQRMRRYVPYMLFYELDEQNYEKDRVAKRMKEQEIDDEYQERNKQNDSKIRRSRLDKQILVEIEEYNVYQQVGKQQKFKQNMVKEQVDDQKIRKEQKQ